MDVSSKIVQSLDRMFLTHELPCELTSDNGPQFVSSEFEEELNKFLTAYRTTPHGTTGKAPDEMLFKRRLRTKIPELVPFDKCDEEVRDRDAVLKQKGKEYADDKKNAKYPDLKVNDKVLLQQRKTCKTTTMYEHDPYGIVDVNGSQVKIKSGEGVCYKYNSSHVRRNN